ncbi:hypothetical protein ACQKFU_09400 [Bacillus mycoides]|uniref:hypothetical protein n=1 Tax=Bacillus mycoides TaxID=1405 RepID=UPI003CFCB227
MARNGKLNPELYQYAKQSHGANDESRIHDDVFFQNKSDKEQIVVGLEREKQLVLSRKAKQL